MTCDDDLTKGTGKRTSAPSSVECCARADPCTLQRTQVGEEMLTYLTDQSSVECTVALAPSRAIKFQRLAKKCHTKDQRYRSRALTKMHYDLGSSGFFL